jgi:threonine aldolase
VGSVVVGSRDLVERARRIRKMLGGGMRQAGVIAAAALYALDHHVARLAEDHANARLLAEGLAGAGGLRLRGGRVETNIVYLETPDDAGTALAERFAAAGVRAIAGPTAIRLVTHLDVGRDDVLWAVDACRRALGA